MNLLNELNGKRIFFLLLLIIILGFSLRLYNLGSESVWIDESYTILGASQQTIPEVIKSIELTEGKPFLSHMLLHFWMDYFGNSEFSLRFMYLIFGTLSIFVIFFVSKNLFDWRIGLLSSLMLSTSMIQVLYSQEIRSYTLFALLTLCSYYFFIRIIKENNYILYFYYILFTSLAANAHYFNFFNIFIQNLIIFLVLSLKVEQIKKWLLSQLIILILFIPSFFILIKQVKWVHAAFQDLLIFKLHIGWFGQMGVFIFLVPILLLILMFIFVFSVKHKIDFLSFINKFKFSEKTFLLILILVLLTLLFNISKLISPSFLTRYHFFLIPFYYIFISKGVMLIKGKKMQAIFIILILLVNFYSLGVYYSTIKKEQWREAVEFVELNSGENDLLIFNAAYLDTPFNYYYKGDLEQVRRDSSQNINLSYLIPFEHIQEKISTKSGVWLILSHDFWSQGFYKNQLDELYLLTLHKEFKEIKVYYYKIHNS